MRLFLCEKPSQGHDIARVVGANERGAGCLTGTGLAVTWCVGHLLEAAAPERYGEQYKRWSLEHLPIIPTHWQCEVKAATAGQFKIVQGLLRHAGEVVIATDADREGELIAREILEWCGYRGPVRRLWLSALNDASIRKALGALKPGAETLPLYHAALARSRADWLVGMNLSRLFTLVAQRAGHTGVLSVGRVQTPTLHLVVQRDREIAAFQPVPYWSIDVTLQAAGQPFTARWQPPSDSLDEAGHCIREAVAQNALSHLSGARTARVASVDTERIREPPALPFDLSTLQETCSRQLGLEVQRTLTVAQSLYETHKAITYPRSDSQHLPLNMHAEAPALLAVLLRADPALASVFQELEPTQRSRAWNDGNVTAHHALIPTIQAPNPGALSQDERAVYQMIRAHYLAQFLPDHEYDRTRVQLDCSDLALQARGKAIVRIGWRRVLAEGEPDDTEGGCDERQPLPVLRVGNDCRVANLELKALQTLPPRHFTQGELLKAMKGIARWVSDPRLKQKLKETTGIGTEATRAGIISGLITRGYLLQQGRTVRASNTARALIHAIPAAIADPGTTALWEQALDRIAAGRLNVEDFVRQQSVWIADLVRAHADLTWTPAAGTDAPRSGNPRPRRRVTSVRRRTSHPSGTKRE